MPRIDYADAEDFHSLYGGDEGFAVTGQNGTVSLGYIRKRYLDAGFDHARGLIQALGLTASDVVVVIGCAFGGTVEGLQAHLPGIRAVGVDVSPWVQSAKDQTETAYIRGKIVEAGLDPDTGEGAEYLARYDTGEPRATVVVLNEDINGGQAKKNIRSALNLRGNEDIHWAISDDLLTSLTDQEILDNIGAMNALAVNCAHLVTPLGAGGNQDSRLNWKTMQEWRNLINSTGHTGHVLVRVGNYETF